MMTLVVSTNCLCDLSESDTQSALSQGVIENSYSLHIRTIRERWCARADVDFDFQNSWPAQCQWHPQGEPSGMGGGGGGVTSCHRAYKCISRLIEALREIYSETATSHPVFFSPLFSEHALPRCCWKTEFEGTASKSSVKFVCSWNVSWQKSRLEIGLIRMTGGQQRPHLSTDG